MKNKKILTVSLVLAIILGTGLFITTGANANDSNGNFIQRIAERFDLNEDEVQSFFDEVKADKFAQKEEMFADKLNEAVTNDIITEEQKAAIEDHHEEMAAKKDEIKDLPHEERKEAMKNLREEFKVWSEENGIDLGVLHGKRNHFGRGFMH